MLDGYCVTEIQSSWFLLGNFQKVEINFLVEIWVQQQAIYASLHNLSENCLKKPFHWDYYR